MQRREFDVRTRMTATPTGAGYSTEVMRQRKFYPGALLMRTPPTRNFTRPRDIRETIYLSKELKKSANR